MKCPECKSENKEGSKYCKVCGSKLFTEFEAFDEKKVTEISAQNTRLEIGHLLMIGGAIAYFVLFLITQVYEPDPSNLEEVKDLVDTMKILSYLMFFSIIAFMAGSKISIDVLKKR